MEITKDNIELDTIEQWLRVLDERNAAWQKKHEAEVAFNAVEERAKAAEAAVAALAEGKGNRTFLLPDKHRIVRISRGPFTNHFYVEVIEPEKLL